MNHVTTPSKGSSQLQVSSDKQTNKSETFPRLVSVKPPPSPSRDSRISFVSDQSNPEEFTWSAFTPMSQEVFENAYKRHKYFYKFSDKVLKQGTKMKTNAWDAPGKPGETLTYEQLLQGKLINYVLCCFMSKLIFHLVLAQSLNMEYDNNKVLFQLLIQRKR